MQMNTIALPECQVHNFLSIDFHNLNHKHHTKDKNSYAVIHLIPFHFLIAQILAIN